MKNRRIARVIGIVLIIISGFVALGCKGKEAAGGQKKLRVGYANNDDADFFDKYLRDVFEETVKPDSTIEVIFSNAKMDMQTQLDQIDNFIVQKLDVVVLVPVDTAGIVPGIERLNAAGIPAVCICINAGGGDFVYVGNTYIDGGIMQAEYMIEKLPQNARFVYLQGTPGYDHARERRQGFLDTLYASRPDVTLLAEQTGMYERSRGMSIMEDWIQAFPRIDAVIAGNDQMALGALEALKGAGRASGVLIAGVDATNEACRAIKNGEMAMTVLQSAPLDAQGTYEVLKKIQSGQPVEMRYIIPQVEVTVDNG
jgi:inositol transport system substrate-binding protein